MNELSSTTRDLFILGLVLILVVYYIGTTAVGKTFFAGVNQLGLTFTGRDSSGKFAAYPANTPAGGA